MSMAAPFSPYRDVIDKEKSNRYEWNTCPDFTKGELTAFVTEDSHIGRH